MGVAEDVEIDVLGPLELQVGDTFILCSDGLHGVVKEEELLEVASQPIDDAADELLRRALQRGAPDNVTVIVARVERGTDAPDDLLIERMDDTQPLDPMDFAQFEDTVREPLRAVSLEPVPTEPLSAEPVAAEPLSVAPLSAEPSPAEPVTPVAATPDPTLPRTIEVPVPAAAVPAAVVPAQAPRGILKWTVVLALILGAAGAWFFWSRQQPTVAVPSTSSSR
jgi:hypothetical protein